MENFVKSAHLPVSVSEAFEWHTRPGALERQLPPWTKSKILQIHGNIHNGDTVKIKYYFGILRFIMEMQHQNCVENKQFESVQTKGPFRAFKYCRVFEPINDSSSKIDDSISFENSFKLLSFFLSTTFLENKIDNFFAYSHRTLQNDLLLHSKYSQKKLKIMITGASGFVGKELVPFLTSGGHTVLSLGHETYIKQLQDAENFDAVIHLAGENIASKKWTAERKKQLIESRVKFTHELIGALKNLKQPPKIFISASGIGIFGNREADEICDEDSATGKGFLAELAQKWEDATQEAQKLGIRVVNLRFGAILSSSGGMLKKIILPYKLFLGGAFGSGQQRMPWISMTDVLGLILFSLSQSNVVGPMNAVAPQIVSNEEFSDQLADILSRPSGFRLPEIVIEALFGEMGRELFLTDLGAEPEKAQKLGYEFLHPNLSDALFHYLDVNS